MQRRLRAWSLPSPTSMYGTASISPGGSRPVNGNNNVLSGRTGDGPLPWPRSHHMHERPCKKSGTRRSQHRPRIVGDHVDPRRHRRGHGELWRSSTFKFREDGAAPPSRISCSAQPIARTGSHAPRPIGRIRKLATVHGKTTASDAFGQSRLEALELCDPVLDPSHPFTRQARPIAASRDPFGRKFGKLRGDFLKAKTDPLREDDECYPAQHRSGKAAMPRARPLGRDEAPLFVESQRRGRHPATAGHFADRQYELHAATAARIPLDFKFTLTCRHWVFR